MDQVKDPAVALNALQEAFAETSHDPYIIKDLTATLERIMRDCSLANIEAGKTWMFEHCRRVPQIASVMEYMLALSQSRSTFAERLYLVYLTNDILYHSERKDREWIKDAMIPHLVPILRLAYQAAGSNEEHHKVNKVINIWDDRRFFNESVMRWIRQSTATGTTSSSAPLQQQQKPIVDNDNSNIEHTRSRQPPRRTIPAGPSIRPPSPPPPPSTAPPKQYFELPAGSMIPAIEASHAPYTPIRVSQVRPPARLTAERMEALTPAIDDFYAKLDLRDTSNFLEEPLDPKLDHSGWEKGYLDTFYENLKARHESKSERPRWNRSPSPSPPPPSYHRREYGRRESPERRRYGSRRQRSYSSSLSRSRSPPPSRYSRSRAMSPSPPPPPSHRASRDQVCFNCSKTGHVARDCPESPPR